MTCLPVKVLVGAYSHTRVESKKQHASSFDFLISVVQKWIFGKILECWNDVRMYMFVVS